MTFAATARASAVALLLASSALAEPPVERAQTLSYRVAWNGLPAAHATVSIRAEDHAGERTYTVDTSAATNAFVDLFWRFRGNARALFVARDWTPLRFRYERKIDGLRSLTTIDFSPLQQRARSHYVKGGVTKKRLDLSSLGLVDPITAVFKARHGPTEIGTQVGYDIFTGESRYRVELSFDGRDQVDVPAGSFAALRVTPRVWKIRGADQPPDRRLRGATAWVTDDDEHVLLRLRSEVFIGAVSLDLTSREVAS
jgi:hypothetical protein